MSGEETRYLRWILPSPKKNGSAPPGIERRSVNVVTSSAVPAGDTLVLGSIASEMVIISEN
ncbi:MAG: hypothetical protein KJ804_09900 [Proteobacteria bacterium]|nr:hypothetical protein [Pseudomonadota bacterium]MBU1058615.1 hypothetical protein [Pseudomonadota bacterium]